VRYSSVMTEGAKEQDRDSSGVSYRAAAWLAATAYVCEGYACQNPTTDPEGLARQLGIS
jgi:uncharacterized protein YyaL (SSP411 family)